VTVPQPSAEDGRPAKGTMSSSKPGAGGATASATVLILEADDMVRRLIASQLTILGFKPIEVSEPAAARQLLAAANPPIDLLVTGVALLRSTDGVAFAGEIRRAHPATAVLVVSGYIDARLEATLTAEGVHVLAKPFRLKELARKVRSALAARPKAH
jgi:DNA-binding NtrC family response regulator